MAFYLLYTAHAGAAQQLSIADAIHLGVHNNLSIQNAYLSRQSQQQAHRSAKSLFEPVWTADSLAESRSTYDVVGDSRSGSASIGAGLSVGLNTLTGTRFAITARETAIMRMTGESPCQGRLTSRSHSLCCGAG